MQMLHHFLSKIQYQFTKYLFFKYNNSVDKIQIHNKHVQQVTTAVSKAQYIIQTNIHKATDEK